MKVISELHQDEFKSEEIKFCVIAESRKTPPHKDEILKYAIGRKVYLNSAALDFFDFLHKNLKNVASAHGKLKLR